MRTLAVELSLLQVGELAATKLALARYLTLTTQLNVSKVINISPW